MDHLTPRLFHPCQQEQHGVCETTLATYRCCCRCHRAERQQGLNEIRQTSAPMTSLNLEGCVSNYLTAVVKRLGTELANVTGTLNWKHLRQSEFGTKDALSVVNRFN